jgi:hypothetical protein
VPTTWVILATDTIHPPACATTLFVSLDLLSTPLRVGIIVGSVLLLVVFHGVVLRGFDRLGGTTPQDYLGLD